MSDVAPTGNPPLPKKPQNVFCVFPKGLKFTGLPGGGVPGKGNKIDKYTGALRTTTPAGHGVDPRVGKPPQYVLIPMWDVFPLGVPQRLSP